MQKHDTSDRTLFSQLHIFVSIYFCDEKKLVFSSKLIKKTKFHRTGCYVIRGNVLLVRTLNNALARDSKNNAVRNVPRKSRADFTLSKTLPYELLRSASRNVLFDVESCTPTCDGTVFSTHLSDVSTVGKGGRIIFSSSVKDEKANL